MARMRRSYVGFAVAALALLLIWLDYTMGRGWLAGGCIVILLGLAAYELQALAGEDRSSAAGAWTVAGTVLVALAVLVFAGDKRSAPVVEPFTLALCFVAVCLALVGDVGKSFRGTALAVLGIVYVGYFGSYLIRLRFMGTQHLVFVVACVKLCDSAAYYFGTYMGRHPLAPVRSPKKTVEGAVGGFGVSVLAAIALSKLLGLGLRYGIGGPILFGAVIGTLSHLGDLVESSFKRAVGRKDSGAVMPYIGGVLDLLDSLILAAPVAWLLLDVLTELPRVD